MPSECRFAEFRPLVCFGFRMAWHVPGRTAAPAQGLAWHDALASPLDLEYARNDSTRNSPAWWSPQRLSLLDHRDNVTSGSLVRTPSVASFTPGAFRHPLPREGTLYTPSPGMLKGNYQLQNMGLAFQGRAFTPLHTPMAQPANSQHFAAFTPLTAPKMCHSFSSSLHTPGRVFRP